MNTARLISFIAFLFLFTGTSLALQVHTGGFATDRGNHSDEAAHFVSSLVIADYIRDGAPMGPIAYAREYYLHFPKVAIGHWPPLFEGLQALVFLLLGGTGTAAIAFQAVIAGLACSLPAMVVQHWRGWPEGLLAGFAVLLCPAFLPMLDMVMADTLLAVTVTLTALAWAGFYRQRSWGWAVLFALAATAAILTKGTGFGLALLPLIHIAIKGDGKLLLNPKTIVAGMIVAVLTLPWYALTYRMAADGFVYSWGWGYTHLAVPFFLHGLVCAIGIPAALGYIAGIYWCVKERRQDARLDVTAFIATSLAMLLFSMLAPADLDSRYLIPVLPSVAIVAIYGVYRTIEAFAKGDRRELFARVITILLLAGGIAVMFQMPYPRNFASDHLARDIIATGEANPLVMVSGSVQAEGAVISSFAQIDRSRHYYVIRAQKALATSNWMASSYTLKFNSPAEVAHWVEDNHIGWIVIDSTKGETEFPHNVLLRQAIVQGLLKARPVEFSMHSGGIMVLYALPAENIEAQMTPSLAAAAGPGHLGDLGK